MKKSILCLPLLALLAMSVTGCGRNKSESQVSSASSASEVASSEQSSSTPASSNNESSETNQSSSPEQSSQTPSKTSETPSQSSQAPSQSSENGSSQESSQNPDIPEVDEIEEVEPVTLNDEGLEEHIADAYKFSEQLVEQGSVLFKNEDEDGNPVLPLQSGERKVTLFGRASRNLYYRSGAGGAAPNDKLVVTLDKAFENCGFEINKTVFNLYTEASRSGGSAEMSNPNSTIEASPSIYTQAAKNSFSEYNDAAIVTFCRVGTENSDPNAGQLDLKDNEKQLLKMIHDSGDFEKTIVLINGPLAMSMDWVNDPEYGVDACIFMGVPGYYGVEGIVHVIMGEDRDGNPVSPSGHAPDTFAASASSSPAYVNFGNGPIAYLEGVYVGYKYYETRYADAVLGQGNATGSKGVFKSSDDSWNYAEEMGYPFGYGQSYTTFEQKLVSVTYNEADDTIDAVVEVENTGDMDAKAVVQLYVSAPYTDFDKDNGLGKSAISLMAYHKVDVPAGDKKLVGLSFDRYFLCTYDNVENKTYILEDGEYYFAVGNGAHEALNNVLSVQDPSASLYDHNGLAYQGDADAVKTLYIDEDLTTYSTSHYNDEEVTNQFDDADYNYWAELNGKEKVTYLDRQDWEATWPTKISESPATRSQKDMSQYYAAKPDDAPNYNGGDGVDYNVPYVDSNGNEYLITFDDMIDVPLEGIVEEGKFEGEEGADIWDAFVKQLSLNDLAISVSDYRGILDVRKVLKRGNSVAEGPEGLLAKYQYGDKRWATGFPTGPTYTGTFDHAMQRKYGRMFGRDALFAGIAAVNAVGANINRTPYGSRASEYMSEDGIMNYQVASSIVSEARKQGLIMNIKHCMLNNQETGRQGIETFCNEQAIREIYIKPFEGALTKGQGLGIMTSYNRIGIRYSACHEPLMQNVMRGEWGYQGLIIDDALTGSNTNTYSNGPAMLHCGTDLFCLDGNRGGQLKDWVTSKNDGGLVQDLQRANKYIMAALTHSMLAGFDKFAYFDSSSEESNAPIIKEQETWNYSASDLSSLKYGNSRSGHTLVYKFEGEYSEGYQGQYNTYKSDIYLWDDGLFCGKSNSGEFKGYWYNSSLANGEDENGDDIADCLIMIGNTSHFESIICSPVGGNRYQAYIYMHPGWGDGRSVVVTGYLQQ